MGETRMIETIVPPRTLDNDIAVIKILQLMGQLSLNDIRYLVTLAKEIMEKAEAC
jgi:hypothetical protein